MSDLNESQATDNTAFAGEETKKQSTKKYLIYIILVLIILTLGGIISLTYFKPTPPTPAPNPLPPIATTTPTISPIEQLKTPEVDKPILNTTTTSELTPTTEVADTAPPKSATTSSAETPTKKPDQPSKPPIKKSVTAEKETPKKPEVSPGKSPTEETTEPREDMTPEEELAFVRKIMTETFASITTDEECRSLLLYGRNHFMLPCDPAFPVIKNSFKKIGIDEDLLIDRIGSRDAFSVYYEADRDPLEVIKALSTLPEVAGAQPNMYYQTMDISDSGHGPAYESGVVLVQYREGLIRPIDDFYLPPPYVKKDIPHLYLSVTAGPQSINLDDYFTFAVPVKFKVRAPKPNDWWRDLKTDAFVTNIEDGKLIITPHELISTELIVIAGSEKYQYPAQSFLLTIYDPTDTTISDLQVVVDRDGDGLIEINTAAELDTYVRNEKEGRALVKSAKGLSSTIGCPTERPEGWLWRPLQRLPLNGTFCYGYELTADIDLSEFENWKFVVIGGVFEGNGHTVSNLLIKKTLPGRFDGLFARAKIMRNMHIPNARIVGPAGLEAKSCPIGANVLAFGESDGKPVTTVGSKFFSGERMAEYCEKYGLQ